MRRKIALAGIIIAIIGLYIELVLYQGFNSVSWGYLSTLSLDSLDIGRHISDSINYINVFFYSLLLTGGILYLLSKNENRLIRYIFSIIFFTKSLFLFWAIITLPFSYKTISGFKGVLFLLAALIAMAGWTFLSYKILKYFSAAATLRYITQKNYLGEDVDMIVAAKWPKRVFNRLTDLLVMALIFLPFLRWIIRTNFVREIGYSLKNEFLMRVVIYLFIALLQVIYYFVFESIFQATPGKFLTGTRVVTEDGGKPTVKQIFKRTVTRIVPFEAFSIFGQLWHDTWSETYLVNEKREGVKGGYYFLIIPVYLILGVGTYVGVETYRSNQYKKKDKEDFELKRNEIISNLDKLTDKYFITISEGYAEKLSYLKTESIEADGITFTYINYRDQYGNHSTNHVFIEKLYESKKDSLPKVKLSKKQLLSGVEKYAPIGSPERYSDTKGGQFFGDGKYYTIKNVSEWYGPNPEVTDLYISERYYSRETGTRETVKISIFNKGWAGVIRKLEDNTDVGYEWKTRFPTELPAMKGHRNNIVLLATAEEIEEID